MTPTDPTILRQRIQELLAVRTALLPDIDDATVLCEITSIEAALERARHALHFSNEATAA